MAAKSADLHKLVPQDKQAGGQRQKLLLASGDLRLFGQVIDPIRDRFDIAMIEQGWAALEMLRKGKYDAAIINADLPGLSGFDVAKRLRRDVEAGEVRAPVLLVSWKDPRMSDPDDEVQEMAEACISAPFDAASFLVALWDVVNTKVERDWDKLNYVQASVLKVTRNNLKSIFGKAALEGKVEPELSVDCSRALVEAAQSNDLNGVLVSLRDHHSYTFVHSLKVAGLMTVFGKEVGLKQGDMELLAQGGLLHDVGKAITGVHLLEKPSRLSPEEWEEMKLHVNHSGRILRASEGIPVEAINIAERHHEKIDGTGYPFGLKGGQMDDLSLISAMMDVYSALNDKRSYKPSLSPQKSIEIMETMAGKHLEPGFFTRFREMVLDGVID